MTSTRLRPVTGAAEGAYLLVAHRARLLVESTVGNGSTFFFSLPAQVGRKGDMR